MLCWGMWLLGSKTISVSARDWMQSGSFSCFSGQESLPVKDGACPISVALLSVQTDHRTGGWLFAAEPCPQHLHCFAALGAFGGSTLWHWIRKETGLELLTITSHSVTPSSSPAHTLDE